MNKYVTYSEYKSSGHQFIPDIPIFWKRAVLSSISDIIDPQPDHRAPAICNSDLGFPYIGIRDVNKDGNLNFETARPVEESAVLKQERSFKIEPHNIIFCKVGTLGLPRKIIPHGRCALSATLVLIKAKQNVNSQYLLYALDSDVVISQTNYLATGSTRAALGIQQIRKFQIPFPSVLEQNQIANFLDHETAKIDILIEKQQQLIKLLKEKRQAVISHAVTKGIPNKEHPNTPMKDSGVEWLGEVPEHWVVTKIKYITSLFEQGWSPQCDSRTAEVNEYGILKVGCVNHGIFKPLENKALPKELEPKLQYIINKGDLLISRANTKELVGSAAVVTKDYENLILCDKLYRLKLNSNISPELLSLYLSISAVRGQIELGASGASHSMQNIGQDVIKELPCFVIPHEESLRLLEYIKGLLNKFSLIINKSELQIRLLQERRTALISAAVTGKIDVRNWEQPNDE